MPQEWFVRRGEKVKAGLADLVSTAKKAKDFAVAQTRKTQITLIILPKAYLALGREIFEEGRFSDEFADLFERISAANAEIEKVKASTNERPKATDLKGKLQSGAANLMAQGQTAKLGLQRDSQLRALGKKSFESHGAEAGSPDVVSPITAALDELQKIEARIAETISGEGVPLWQRIPVAALLTFFCFPVGLYLLWHNPRISRRTKLIWGGGLACLLIIGGIATRNEIENAKGELAAASQLWSADDKPAAISKYRALVKRHFLGVPQSERSVIIGRVIDFDAESGNNSSVEGLLQLAEDEHIVPSISSEKAGSIIARRIAEKQKVKEPKLPDKAQPTEVNTNQGDRPAENVYRFTLAKKRQYTDEEFDNVSLAGATAKQVLDHFGKPDGVHKNSQYNDDGDIRSSKESWNYYNLVKHSATGKRLALHIYFRNSDGKVITHEVL